jgi:hypothetical protein
MLSITRKDAHPVYGQRVTRDGEHVGYVGKDADGNWAVKPLDGRVMIGRKLRRDALTKLEEALDAAARLEAEMAERDAAYEADQAEAEAALEDRMAAQEAEAGSVERALQDALAADVERRAQEAAEQAAAKILDGVREYEARQAEQEAELEAVLADEEDPQVAELLRQIYGAGAPAATQPPVRDLDWSDVVADGERAAAEAEAPVQRLAAEMLRPGMRVTLVSTEAALPARQGTIIGVRDGKVRFHDAATGYAERDAEWWAVYPRLTAEEAELAGVLERLGGHLRGEARGLAAPVETLTYGEMHAALSTTV